MGVAVGADRMGRRRRVRAVARAVAAARASGGEYRWLSCVWAVAARVGALMGGGGVGACGLWRGFMRPCAPVAWSRAHTA